VTTGLTNFFLGVAAAETRTFGSMSAEYVIDCGFEKTIGD
jgi:hypothetical protein